VNEQTRFNLAEAISRLANIGRADPTIANHRGIKVGPPALTHEFGRPSAAQVRRDCRRRPVDFVARRSSYCVTIWW
jgi:hypothetical protein